MPNRTLSPAQRFRRKIGSVKLHAPLHKARRRQQKVVCFYVPSSFMFAYCAPIWEKLRQHTDVHACFIVEQGHSSDPVAHLLSHGVPGDCILATDGPEAVKVCDLFVTPDTFNGAPRSGCPVVEIFHGLAGWGLVKSWCRDKTTFASFDHLFITGPRQDRLLALLAEQGVFPADRTIGMHHIGYPKTDILFQGQYSKRQVCEDLRLDQNRPLVLYAPTWEKEASLYTCGTDIMETLARSGVNVIVKLHSASYFSPGEPEYQGVDWRERMQHFEREHPNVRNIMHPDANPYMVASDMMMTDVSGVGFEFLLIDKPIIYMRCPTFEKRYGLSPQQEEAYQVGAVVDTIDQLGMAVDHAITNPSAKSPARREFARTLVYNAGRASDAAVATIKQILSRS